MGKRKNGLMGLLRGLLLPVAAVVALLWFAAAVDSLDAGRSAEDLRQLEAAVRRGCAACYAAEGAYPTDLDYLREHYGLQIDEEHYIVHYYAYAENLMPDIMVLERET